MTEGNIWSCFRKLPCILMERGNSSATVAIPILLKWFTNSSYFLFANKQGQFLKIGVGILPQAASKSCLTLKAAFLLFWSKATHPVMFLNGIYLFLIVEFLKKLSSSLIGKNVYFILCCFLLCIRLKIIMNLQFYPFSQPSQIVF